MRDRLMSLLLAAFRRLPRPARVFAVRLLTPRFTVGAVVVVRRSPDQLLLVRQRHTGRWALPGGLLGRGETPAAAARRELGEELAVELAAGALSGEPATTVVEPHSRRIDLVFLAEEAALHGAPRVDGVEVLDVGWFPLSDLPQVTGPTRQILAAAGLSTGRGR